jgi:hypothetical protein
MDASGSIVAGHCPSHWRSGQRTRLGAASARVEYSSGHRTTKWRPRPSRSMLQPKRVSTGRAYQHWSQSRVTLSNFGATRCPSPMSLSRGVTPGVGGCDVGRQRWRQGASSSLPSGQWPEPCRGLNLASGAAGVGRAGEVDRSRIFELDLLARTRRSGRPSGDNLANVGPTTHPPGTMYHVGTGTRPCEPDCVLFCGGGMNSALHLRAVHGNQSAIIRKSRRVRLDPAGLDRFDEQSPVALGLRRVGSGEIRDRRVEHPAGSHVAGNARGIA